MDVFADTVPSAVLFFVFLVTLVILFRYQYGRERETSDPVPTLIVIGSGGHTKEILTLTEKLDSELYSPRQYVVASTDSISIKKIHASEKLHQATNAKSKYTVNTVPRSREVKQSWFTTFFTTLYASLYSLPLVFYLKPQVILCNGPGTCVPLCYAGLLLKWFGVTDTKIVYVESICRVETLSLSARILYPVADSLIVQWPDLVKKYPRCKYIGRVV